MRKPNRLRELRKAAGFTLKDLPDKTGKAFQTIAEYETLKQEMPEDFLMKAALVFRISPEQLFPPATEDAKITPPLKETTVPYRTATDQTLAWLIGSMAWDEIDRLAKDAVDQKKREVAMKLLEVAETAKKDHRKI
jgi:transcriptional regulator with XRE-family HTH domain